MPMESQHFNSQVYSTSQNLELLSCVQNPSRTQKKLIKRIIHRKIVNFVNFQLLFWVQSESMNFDKPVAFALMQKINQQLIDLLKSYKTGCMQYQIEIGIKVTSQIWRLYCKSSRAKKFFEGAFQFELQNVKKLFNRVKFKWLRT